MHAFSTFNWIDVDYGSFYENAKNMTAYKYDFVERYKDICSVSELEKKVLNVFLRAYVIRKEM